MTTPARAADRKPQPQPWIWPT